jgi:hypothetical protein
MEVIVCGDSFCSASKHHRNHFSQILEDNYGYSVINLARGGASAINIGYQIQQAIELKPDVVIYSRAKFPRLDIPVNNKTFNPALGLKNFVYANPSEVSHYSPYVGDNNASIFSNNYGSLFPDPLYNEKLFLKVSDEQRLATKQFSLHLYDENLSIEVDKWIYEYWEFKLAQNNIKYILFNDIGQEALTFSQNKSNYPEIYHTDPATQQIVAKNAHGTIQMFEDNG